MSGSLSGSLNRYSIGRYALIVTLVLLGVAYAVPSFFRPDFAIQIRPEGSSVNAQELIHETLSAAKINVNIEPAATGGLLLRMESNIEQLRAQRLIRQAFAAADETAIIALALVPSTPSWLAQIGGRPMNYGLDLSGGVHFLLEVDIDKAQLEHLAQAVTQAKNLLREARIRYDKVTPDGNRLHLVFRRETDRDNAETLLLREMAEYDVDAGNDPISFRLFMRPEALTELENYAISQNLQSLRNRVNELGVTEPLVQRIGRHRIAVDLPGIQDSAKAKDIIGKVANLEFRLESLATSSAADSITYSYEGRRVKLVPELIVTGDRVTNAQAGFDPETSLPQVNITLDSVGGDLMLRATRDNIGRRMAVIFKEIKTTSDFVKNPDGSLTEETSHREHKRLISLATVQAALGARFRITGLSQAESSDLALLLRAGALAAPMYIVEERTVGASLGEENIQSGIRAVVGGLLLVLLFMVIRYRQFGLAANFALIVNITLLVAVMSIIGATLTLPGIAGIVLTVGMAVDANVLIFARIREELVNHPPQQAIHEGFGRAIVTILDANITTFIVAIVLYLFGTGPVRGFAVTLAIGILTSIFSAIWVTRGVVNLMYGGRTIRALKI